MDLWQLLGLILGSSVMTALINHFFTRGKTKADAASALVEASVDVVKLKDDIIRELRGEFAEREQKLTLSLEDERTKRRALDGRLQNLEGEKKTWKIRWMPSKARISFSNNGLSLPATRTNGWRGRIPR